MREVRFVRDGEMKPTRPKDGSHRRVTRSPLPQVIPTQKQQSIEEADEEDQLSAAKGDDTLEEKFKSESWSTWLQSLRAKQGKNVRIRKATNTNLRMNRRV